MLRHRACQRFWLARSLAAGDPRRVTPRLDLPFIADHQSVVGYVQALFDVPAMKEPGDVERIDCAY
ncbi:MAG: hypothetical protein IT184_14025 [Acidobacteria bacterium]|nr:hypothetical protein [Acidobacteriota bacterium]